MKPYTYAFLAAAAACGLAQAADTAYTTPVGYTTQTLAANKFNVVGFNVLTPSTVAGDISAVSVSSPWTVSDSAVDFTTALPVGKTCVLEITSGTAAGTVQEFVSWTGSDITIPAQIAGLTAGDKYTIRVAPTLQEVFPISPTSFLAGSVLATTADKVWVPNGNGTYTRYWIKTNDPIVNPGDVAVNWHTTTTGANDTGKVTTDVPLINIDALLVEKKTVAKDLVLSGEVKKTGSNVLLVPGFNPVSVNPPVGLTLFTSGMFGDISGSVLATTADTVWVPNGDGTYIRYWIKTNDPIVNPGDVAVNWHTTTTGQNDTGKVTVDVTLPSGVLIQRKGATSKVITLDVPTSYSSL